MVRSSAQDEVAPSRVAMASGSLNGLTRVEVAYVLQSMAVQTGDRAFARAAAALVREDFGRKALPDDGPLNEIRYLLEIGTAKSVEQAAGFVAASMPGQSFEATRTRLYPDSSIVRKTACHGTVLGFVMGHDLRRLFVFR